MVSPKVWWFQKRLEIRAQCRGHDDDVDDDNDNDDDDDEDDDDDDERW